MTGVPSSVVSLLPDVVIVVIKPASTVVSSTEGTEGSEVVVDVPAVEVTSPVTDDDDNDDGKAVLDDGLTVVLLLPVVDGVTNSTLGDETVTVASCLTASVVSSVVSTDSSSD